MSEFKLCKNGHYYANNLEECPYCPKPGFSHSGPNQLKNTIISTPKVDSGWDHTKVETTNQIPVTNTPGTTVPAHNAANNLAKTQLLSGTPAPQAERKLAGWLVSYTINPFGVDFRLYEGRNLIGADPACDIVVPNDLAVSGRHLTILYRVDGFRFKDEFSTNGTFINGEIRDEGTLQDGDTIRVGSTTFKFRSAL